METTVGLILVKTVSKSSRANVASLALCSFARQHTLTASCGCVAVVASGMAEFWLLSGSARST